VLHPADESDRKTLPHGPDPREGDPIGLPVAEEDQGAPGPDRVHRLYGGSLTPGGLEGDVHPVSAGPLADGADYVVPLGVERRRRAEQGCRLSPMRQGLRGQDATGPAELSHPGDQEAEGAAAEDGHRVADSEMGEIHGVDRDTQRLAGRARRQGHAGRKGKNKGGGVGQVFAEGAGRGRAAEEPEVAAQIRMPQGAVPTLAAGDGRVHGHGRPGRRAVRARPEALDDAGHLVSQDVADRELQFTDPSVGVVVQIRAAQPHRPDPDQDFAFARGGNRSLFQSDLTRRDDFGDSHGLARYRRETCLPVLGLTSHRHPQGPALAGPHTALRADAILVPGQAVNGRHGAMLLSQGQLVVLRDVV